MQRASLVLPFAPQRGQCCMCCFICLCVAIPMEVCCLEVGRCAFDLSNWNTNTARTRSGPFFFIYSSKVPRVVELRDYISNTRLTSKYYRTSAIEGLPAPNLCHSLTWGGIMSLWPTCLFLFWTSLFPAPTLPFPCPLCHSYLFAHSL